MVQLRDCAAVIENEAYFDYPITSSISLFSISPQISLSKDYLSRQFDQNQLAINSRLNKIELFDFYQNK